MNTCMDTKYNFKYSTNTWKGQIQMQIRKLQVQIAMRYHFPMFKHEKNYKGR